MQYSYWGRVATETFIMSHRTSTSTSLLLNNDNYDDDDNDLSMMTLQYKVLLSTGSCRLRIKKLMIRIRITKICK